MIVNLDQILRTP